MPEPTYEQVNNAPAWEWLAVFRWAGLTGHVSTEESIQAYREAFGEDPLPWRAGGLLSAESRAAVMAERAQRPTG